MTHGRASKGAARIAFTLTDLAAKLDGKVEGDGARSISGVAGIAEAGPDDITFVAASRNLPEAESTAAGAILAGPGVTPAGRDIIRVDNPHLAFARVLDLFHPRQLPPAGIHPTACVDEGADLDPSVAVGAFCYVASGVTVGPRSVLGSHCILAADSALGADVLLHPRVTVLAGVQVGDRSIIHSGSVLGSDGYGYVHDGSAHRKIPQVGTVIVGDDVEIGANVTIDRATTGATCVGSGTKIDNLVQIAHNVEIGDHSLIISQVGISGSTRIGSGVVLAGQVGIAGHVTIGDGAVVGAQSGVMTDVPPGETRSGIGPLPHRTWLRAQAAFEKLPDFRRRLKQLEKKTAGLEETLSAGTSPPAERESS
jgi:UDP-3-O-[3-hydroxymyristoyl] glucosamine N-acyltransferase